VVLACTGSINSIARPSIRTALGSLLTFTWWCCLGAHPHFLGTGDCTCCCNHPHFSAILSRKRNAWSNVPFGACRIGACRIGAVPCIGVLLNWRLSHGRLSDWRFCIGAFALALLHWRFCMSYRAFSTSDFGASLIRHIARVSCIWCIMRLAYHAFSVSRV
jgi:hypothetical protein